MKHWKPAAILLFLMTVGVVLLWAAISPGGSPVNCIQSTAGTTCGPTSLTVTTGDVVAVCQVMGSSTDVSNAPTDSVNTYTKCANCTKVQGAALAVSLWTATAASSATLSITCNTSASTKFVCGMENYSGVTSIGSASTPAGQASGTPMSISQTSTGNNSYMIGCMGNSSGGGNITANTGTLRTTGHTTTSSAANMGLNDNTAVSSGTSITNAVNVPTGNPSAALSIEFLAGAATVKPQLLPLVGTGQ